MPQNRWTVRSKHERHAAIMVNTCEDPDRCRPTARFSDAFSCPAQSPANTADLFAFCLPRHDSARRIVFFIEQTRRAGLRWLLQAFSRRRNKTVLFMTQIQFTVIQLIIIKNIKLTIGTMVAKSLSTLNLWRLR
ncbi:MAG TPA: hypothetical protein PKH28_01145 [Candidatus Competibacteraceae bacterium]|nr:hypothetical protein [Candidatus Competibacteraceae bacterium]